MALLLAGSLAAGGVHAAQPFIWDQDGNGVDDRIESVHLLGYEASFEFSDTTARQRIEVSRIPGGLAFGIYVRWNHAPTPADLATLALLGVPTLTRIEAVPATRGLATFAQAQAIAGLPGVDRVEAAPLLYPELRDGAATIGIRDPGDRVFPTWDIVQPGVTGHGSVIAVLDTGANDLAEGGYPGHESLRQRCLGGASFLGPDSVAHTRRSGSVNPSDHGGELTRAHGSHVAAIALGVGSEAGYFKGVAPGARLIDVKVLDDTGRGVAVPEALDWCISNRARAWAGAGPDESGIDVINLSLSSPDASDGQDLASQLAARAVSLGICVVAAMGNDGLAAHVPSPAAGDGVIAVGAWDAHRSADPSDDRWPTFGNTGPRASDADGDDRDELKPDLIAPAVDVLSANGDLTTDGSAWQRLSGTSMSAAFVSGVVARLREAAPGWTPAQITELLRATARRPLPGAPAGTGGPDPRWRSTRGCGLVDAYAAWLELVQPERTQMRRLDLSATSNAVLGTLWTGRERSAGRFVFERAPDIGGAPGSFAAFDSVAAAGDSSLADGTSISEYARAWLVPAGEAGWGFWYRAACVENGVRSVTPARRFVNPGGPLAATMRVTIVHNAYDSDVDAGVQVGPWASGGPWIDLPGTAGAVATDAVDGTSVTGDLAWTFELPIVAAAGDPWLPPDANRPWTLRVTDAGSLARSGRISDFRVTWHAPGGDQVFVGGPLPTPTLEGGTVQVRVPASTTDAPPVTSRAGFAGPNPARAGSPIQFRVLAGGDGWLRVHDPLGRQVARLALARSGDGWSTRWEGRDDRGARVGPGVYFARVAGTPAFRLVLLTD